MTDPGTPTTEELAQVDPAYWASVNRIRLGAGEFTFKGHAYQLDPLQDRARRQCTMKATQGGWSLVHVLRTLHALIHKFYPLGALYLFPTAEDVGDFSKTRFDPLIQDNPQSIGRFVKTAGQGTDTTSLKKIGSAFLYLRGTRLSQRVGVGEGGMDSSKLASIPVDCVVFDELDLMDQTAIPKALARMGASNIKQEVYLSNPRLPGRGIDKLFHSGDQQYIFRRCGCGEWNCPDEVFPDYIGKRGDGTGYCACRKCGRPLGLHNLKYVAKIPANARVMVSRHWSRLSSSTNDPAVILDHFNDPPDGKLADVYNLELGLPYVEKEAQLQPAEVYECCGQDMMADRSTIACAMGVDIGREFHIVILYRTARDRYEIVRLARIPYAASQVTMDSAFGVLHDLIRRFNVRSAVIDIRPYEHQVRQFQKAEQCRILLCEYTENALVGNAVDEKKGIVKAYRTGLLDTTHRLIAERLVGLPRRCPEVDVFAAQVCATAKVLEKDKKTGVSVYRYLASDDDHYRHALGYAWLAAQNLPVTPRSGAAPRPQTAICDDPVI